MTLIYYIQRRIPRKQSYSWIKSTAFSWLDVSEQAHFLKEPKTKLLLGLKKLGLPLKESPCS